MSTARLEIAPGALHLPHYLTLEQQQEVAALCLDLGQQPAGFYTPIVRGGGTMSVRMLCLGRHWNARTYAYEPTRSDIDGLPAPALPPQLAALAAQTALDAGFSVTPDTCIVNWYTRS